MTLSIKLLVALCGIGIWHFGGNPTKTLADITNWQTGETLPGAEGITPGPGMVLDRWNTDAHNLRYADFSGGLDLQGSMLTHDWLDFALFTQANLTGASFYGSTLTGANLSQANLTLARFFYFFGISNLTDADLSHANLTSATLGYSTLTGATLSRANLTGASFWRSALTGADLTDATVVGASFEDTTSRGFTQEQLYSTASYKIRDLSGIRLGGNDLAGWDFAEQDLTGAYFESSTLIAADLRRANLTGAFVFFATLTGANLRQANLTGANFHLSTLAGADLTDAIVRGAYFGSTTFRGFTQEQLYSTASYQNRELAGIGLNRNDLSGWDFAGQNLMGAKFDSSTLTGANLMQANLTDASFTWSTLTGADFTDAIVAGAHFSSTTSTSFTKEQLYSTASYKNRNLAGIGLQQNDLTDWIFTGQDLTNASFLGSTLPGADLTDAIIWGASFENTTRFGLTKEQLYSTASYKNRDLSGINLGGNDLTDWNFARQNLTNANLSAGLTGVDLSDAVVLGASFVYTAFTPEQLYSTASYKNRDLSGIDLSANDLTGWNFAGQNLTNASFYGAKLEGADLADAVVAGVDFEGATSGGFTQEQLYSTASYKNLALARIRLHLNDLTGWNFAGQNLAGANFGWSTLTGADLSQASLTNAAFAAGCGGDGFYSWYCPATLTDSNLTGADTRGAWRLELAGATVTNTILHDGHVAGLELGPGQTLVVRDYDGDPGDPDPWDGDRPPIPPLPIHVEQQFVMDAGGMLQMLFEADAWDSTISFDAGIPVTLGGTLGLDFAPGVDLASQIGRSFQVFDWTGVTPSGQFDIASPYLWDVSSLYTAGQVTFVGIPEPSSIALALAGISSMAFWQRRQ